MSSFSLIWPRLAFRRQSSSFLASPFWLPSPPHCPASGFRLSFSPTFIFQPLCSCFSAAKFSRLPPFGWSAFTFPPPASTTSPLPTAFASASRSPCVSALSPFLLSCLPPSYPHTLRHTRFVTLPLTHFVFPSVGIRLLPSASFLFRFA